MSVLNKKSDSRQRKQQASASVLALAGCLTLVIGVTTGCGGSSSPSGGTSPVVGRSTGGMTFTITWPEASRLIPKAAKSIEILIKSGEVVVKKVVITSPGPGKQSTQRIDSLAPGPYSVEVRAFPNTDGTGIAQAIGTMNVTVIADQNVPANLELASTIQAAYILPASPTVEVGKDLFLSAELRNKLTGGDLVLTDPANLKWEITAGDAQNTGVKQADGRFKLTGVVAGNLTVKLTETESGKFKSATINITPKQPTIVTLPTTVDGQAITASEGYGINESGQIVGKVTVAGADYPFRTLTNGTIQRPKNTAGAAEVGQANGINNKGDVIGTIRTGTARRAFLWTVAETKYLDLGFLNAYTNGSNFSEGHAINNAGTMTGFAKDWCGCWRSFRTEPYDLIDKGDGNTNSGDGFSQWGDDIGTLKGTGPVIFVHTFSYAINATGRVAGFSTTTEFKTGDSGSDDIKLEPISSYVAFLTGAQTAATTESEKPFITTGDSRGTAGSKPDSIARGINDAGDVVGWAGDITKLPSTWSGEIATIRLTSDAQMRALGSLGNANNASRAYDINNNRQVVGYCFNDSGVKRAFLWENNVMIDLNTKLPANSGWVLSEARGINDKGQITGIGTKDGKTQAFLLTLNP